MTLNCPIEYIYATKMQKHSYVVWVAKSAMIKALHVHDVASHLAFRPLVDEIASLNHTLYA